ncbi:hypothetical protein [Rhodopseudomonas sp. P2A-2r]|uniref:hypothetical protein n=1 Tax=unclassified Rhodopseudomonas TaxID=2638247 RepID=UPI0022345F19|nr:hypothetical protein [Rhodopseudomonas sp. P2A-2r]UZE47595.1 hypothetical protein ONR75_22185 [Rhodopseudomonas sp. P2A-2r]
MPYYRAYIVGHNGHFNSSKDIIADDDETAITIAERLVNRHDVELWQRDRRLAVLPCNRMMAEPTHEDKPLVLEEMLRPPSFW